MYTYTAFSICVQFLSRQVEISTKVSTTSLRQAHSTTSKTTKKKKKKLYSHTYYKPQTERRHSVCHKWRRRENIKRSEVLHTLGALGAITQFRRAFMQHMKLWKPARYRHIHNYARCCMPHSALHSLNFPCSAAESHKFCNRLLALLLHVAGHLFTVLAFVVDLHV